MAPLEETTLPKINNVIHGVKKQPSPSSSSYMEVTSPSTSKVIAHVYKSTKADVEEAVESSKKAFESWSALTMKSRVAIIMKFHSLVKIHAKELAELIVLENGKNITEGTLFYFSTIVHRGVRVKKYMKRKDEGKMTTTTRW